MYIGDYCVSVHDQLGLEGGTISDNQAGAQRTHIEDNEDPVELRLPSGNRLLVIPRVKKSRDCTASALFGDFILYFRNGPAVEGMVSRRTRNYNIASSTHVIS